MAVRRRVLEHAGQADRVDFEGIDPAARGYHWPGNVREVRNVIERAVILSTGPRLVVSLPQPAVARRPQSSLTLRNLEIEHIRATLDSTSWRIRGHGGAASGSGSSRRRSRRGWQSSG